MSKHSTAEEKLRIGPEVQSGAKSRRPTAHPDKSPTGPPKGTNANNQYR